MSEASAATIGNDRTNSERTHDLEQVDGNELVLLREKPPKTSDGSHEKTPETDETTRGRRGSVAVAVAVAVAVVVRWYCYWTISCTKLGFLVHDLVHVDSGSVQTTWKVVL